MTCQFLGLTLKAFDGVKLSCLEGAVGRNFLVGTSEGTLDSLKIYGTSKPVHGLVTNARTSLVLDIEIPSAAMLSESNLAYRDVTFVNSWSAPEVS